MLSKTLLRSVIGGTLVSFAALHAAPSEGERLFDAKCVACHIKTRPDPSMRSTFVAPPIMGVMLHVKEAFPGDREGAVAFIRSYVMTPDAAQAKCMPQAIQRFGLMPSQKGNVTEEELARIAGYIYDTFPPAGFQPGAGRNAGSGPNGRSGS